MPIVAARRYVSGQIEIDNLPVDGNPAAEQLPSGAFDWVGVVDPDAAEMAKLQSQFGLHPLAVENAMSPNQIPKVESYGRQLLIVARTADMSEGESIEYGQTSMFVMPHAIVTVRNGSTRAHSTLRHRLEADSERLGEGPDFVAHAILDFIVDGYQPILERLENAVQVMEEQAINAFPDPVTIRRIFRLRRQLRRFDRIVGPMRELCQRLADTELTCIDPASRIWFRDVLDHMRYTLARTQGLKETLVSIVETASLLEQHRQGDMTRKLAAWAAILAVPTAIAGIYGMNFEVMPELHWRYGYFTTLGGIALICMGLWWRFRRIGWL